MRIPRREKLNSILFIVLTALLVMETKQNNFNSVERSPNTFAKILPYWNNIPYKFLSVTFQGGTSIVDTGEGFNIGNGVMDDQWQAKDIHITEDQQFAIKVVEGNSFFEFVLYKINAAEDEFEQVSLLESTASFRNIDRLSFNSNMVDYPLYDPKLRRVVFKYAHLTVYLTIDTEKAEFVSKDQEGMYLKAEVATTNKFLALVHLSETPFNVYLEDNLDKINLCYEKDTYATSGEGSLRVSCELIRGYSLPSVHNDYFLFQHGTLNDYLVFNIGNDVYHKVIMFIDGGVADDRDNEYVETFAVLNDQDFLTSLTVISGSPFSLLTRAELDGDNNVVEDNISIDIISLTSFSLISEKQKTFLNKFGSGGMLVMPNGAIYSIGIEVFSKLYQFETGLNDFCNTDNSHLGIAQNSKGKVLTTSMFCETAQVMANDNCKSLRLFSTECLQCNTGTDCSIVCNYLDDYYDLSQGECESCKVIRGCTRCSINSEESLPTCEVCSEGLVLVNGECKSIEEACPDEQQAYDLNSQTCALCSLFTPGCTKCNFDQQCQECERGKFLAENGTCEECQPGCAACSEANSCDELAKEELNFYLEFQPRMPYLSFKMTILDKENKPVENLPVFIQPGSSRNIFDFTSNGHSLESRTSLNANGDYIVNVALTTEAYQANSQEELNLTVKSKEGSDLSEDYKLSLNPTNLVNIPKKDPNAKEQKVAGAQGPISRVTSGSTIALPAVVAPLSALDASGVLIMSGQFITLSKRFTFINIDFGNSFNGFFENLSEVQPEEKQLDGRALQVIKDKFDKYGISNKFESTLLTKTILYLVGFSLKLIIWIILFVMRSKEKISVLGYKIIKVMRKIHMVLFGICIMDVFFFGLRLVFFAEASGGNATGKILCLLAISFMVYDILELIFARNRINAIEKEEDEVEDEDGVIDLNESAQNLNSNPLEEEEEEKREPFKPKGRLLSPFDIMVLISKGNFKHPQVVRAMENMRRRKKRRERRKLNQANSSNGLPLDQSNNQMEDKDGSKDSKPDLKTKRNGKDELRVIDFGGTYKFISKTNKAMLDYLKTGLKPDKDYPNNSKVPYLTNVIFTLRMIIFQILIISMPQLPGLQVILMMLVEIAYLIFNIVCYKKFKHFKNIAVFLSKVVQSIFVLILFIVFTVINSINSNPNGSLVGGISQGIQGFGIYLIFLAVIIEYCIMALNIIITVYLLICKFLEKKKKTKVRVSFKGIEGFVYRQVAPKRQKKSSQGGKRGTGRSSEGLKANIGQRRANGLNQVLPV